MALYPFLADRCGHVCDCGGLPVYSVQGTLSQAVSQPVQLLRTLLPQRGWSRLASRSAPRWLLPGLLLGADAGDVWCWDGKSGVDGGADRGNGDGKDVSRRSAFESGDRDCVAAAGCALADSSCLATEWECRVRLFHDAAAGHFKRRCA